MKSSSQLHCKPAIQRTTSHRPSGMKHADSRRRPSTLSQEESPEGDSSAAPADEPELAPGPSAPLPLAGCAGRPAGRACAESSRRAHSQGPLRSPAQDALRWAWDAHPAEQRQGAGCNGGLLVCSGRDTPIVNPPKSAEPGPMPAPRSGPRAAPPRGPAEAKAVRVGRTAGGRRPHRPPGRGGTARR